MHKRAAGRCLQHLPDQPFRTRDVGCGRRGHLIKHPSREHDRQPALRLDRLWIERQRVLEKADRLCIDIARNWLKPGGASPKNVLRRIGMQVSRTASAATVQG